MRRFKLDGARIVLIIALSLGLALRLYVWWQNIDVDILQKSSDSVMYTTIAENLIAGKGYVGNGHMIAQYGQPTAFYGPVYPFYLAAIYASFNGSRQAASLSHVVLSMITGILVYFLGKKLYGKMEGALGALIFMVLPEVIVWNHLLISETLYLFLLISIFLLITIIFKKQNPPIWMLAMIGVLFGITYLCRQTIVIAMALLLPFLWLRYKDKGYVWLLQSSALLIVTAALTISPWVIRNYVVFGEPLIGTTTAPATIWWGSVEDRGQKITPAINSFEDKYGDKNEVQIGHLMQREAIQNIRGMSSHEIVRKLVRRAWHLFGLHGRYYRTDIGIDIGIIYMLLSLLGIIGLFITARGSYVRLLMGTFVILTMTFHVLTMAILRYLMPVMPLLAIGSAHLLTSGLNFIKGHKPHKSAGKAG